MLSSKFGALRHDRAPSANEIGSGFKLNNSISAEFAVGSDTKVGIINLIPDPPLETTQPTTAPRDNEGSPLP